MMAHDGGPAFPMTCPGNHPNGRPCSDYHSTGAGMSLLDWFAGQALLGIAAGVLFANAATGQDASGLDTDAEAAQSAYRLAKAMLAEKDKAE